MKSLSCCWVAMFDGSSGLVGLIWSSPGITTTGVSSGSICIGCGSGELSSLSGAWKLGVLCTDGGASTFGQLAGYHLPNRSGFDGVFCVKIRLLGNEERALQG